MGCCVSTNRSYSSPSSNPLPRSTVEGSQNIAPPPEEETVKEVLSETPKWKPKLEATETHKDNLITKSREMSEVSELCSETESVSTLAEEEPRQRINRSPAKVRKTRSFSGEFGGRREMTPARRPDQSPVRKNIGSLRIVRMSNGGTGNQARWQDSGENSGRRSKSPASRTDSVATRSVVGRSPSKRRMLTTESPARVRSASAENGDRKRENSSMECKWPPTANESLENPLVSLECFIFL